MKSRYSIALYTIIIFVLSTITITVWYIVKVGSSIPISFNTIIKLSPSVRVWDARASGGTFNY